MWVPRAFKKPDCSVPLNCRLPLPSTALYLRPVLPHPTPAPLKLVALLVIRGFWSPDWTQASTGRARRSYHLLWMPLSTRLVWLTAKASQSQYPGFQQHSWAWEHGDKGTVTFLSPSPYCNWGADTAVSGLKNGTGRELASGSYRCKRLPRAKETGEQGWKRNDVNVKSIKY